MKIALSKDGIIFKRSEQICLERYGTDNPSKSKLIKDQIKATNLERYGVENPFQSKEKQAKIKATNLERLGVENPFQSKKIKEKIQITWFNHYGVDHPMKSFVIKTKKEATNIERYGVKSPLCKPEIHQAGINAAAKPNIRLKAKQTMIERHGTDCGFKLGNCHTLEIRHKAHETMKREGTYRKSKPEDRCYETLCTIFENVERQKCINRWLIDFYVKDVDCYVQLDGVYWHGLNRQLNEIAKHKTPQDINIHKKFLMDRIQDKWFEANDLKLVRITDIEFDDNPVKALTYIRSRKIAA